MKKPTIITATAILFAAITPAIGTAEHHETSGKSEMGSMNSSLQVTRITEDRLDNLTTAKDLIGSAVYDSAGDKIGDVADISFGRDLASSANSMKSKGSYSSDKKSKDKNYGNTSSDGTKNKMDHSDTMKSRPESIVFISVGGLMGIGDDLVQVPASQLQYDANEEHYILKGVTKDQVANIADPVDQEFNEGDYYADSWYEMNGRNQYSQWDNDDATSRAKREFNSEVNLVRDSFTNVDGLRSVMVEKQGDKIHLTGTVADKSLKKKAEKLAKDSSDLSVENDIKVAGE